MQGGREIVIVTFTDLYKFRERRVAERLPPGILSRERGLDLRSVDPALWHTDAPLGYGDFNGCHRIGRYRRRRRKRIRRDGVLCHDGACRQRKNC